MSFLTQIYNTVLFQPILNLLIYLYDILPWADIGVAIILVTIIVRVLLMPLSKSSLKSQRALQELQPKINEIKNKYKDDKEKQSQELLKFYQENKINPLSSCLPLLIQLPIIFALYRVFTVGLKEDVTNYLYPFVSHPGNINPLFLGFFNLTENNVYFAVIAGALQFWQSRQLIKRRQKQGLNQPKKEPRKDGLPDMSSIMNKQMMYFMPIMTVFIASQLPSGLALYWIVTTLFAIGQQTLIMRNT